MVISIFLQKDTYSKSFTFASKFTSPQIVYVVSIFMNRLVFVFLFLSLAGSALAQRGYYDAPYKRYEAETGTLTNATATVKSYKQSDLQSEASDQVCVNMTSVSAAVEWTLTEAADGLVVRYSVPDGQSGTLGVYDNGTKVSTLTLTSNWSWEYLSTNGNSNNVGVVNTNPKMRFDEVRVKLASKIALGGKLKLIRETGSIYLDFAEMEPVPAAVTAPAGSVTYSGNGSTLQTFINSNGGKTIFIPIGIYSVNRSLYFGVAGTKLQGAGMWYTELNFTNTLVNQGGLVGNAMNVGYSDLYLTTVRNSRTNSYKGIGGVYTSGSVIRNVWVEHFECGAWIAQYNTGSILNADGLLVTNCRFRNNYADGINLCKGTKNSIVEHCSFRNNGDDDMAIWSANNQECQYNTFRYNTSENCWRASGCAIYGGLSNVAYGLLIKDNLEVGLRVNNFFAGSGFNSLGLHEFYDITIDGCGTFNDLFNNQVGAIDLRCGSSAGTQVKNVKFSNIDILNSKNTAIYLGKTGGDGFYNITFQNITINGTGKEYPDNNASSSTAKRGNFIQFGGNPAGDASYCGMTYSNRGGNALVDVELSGKGTLVWTALTDCNLLTVSGNQDASIITNTYSDVVVPAGAVLTMNASKTVHILTIERGGKVTNNEGVALTATNLTINSDASGTGTFVDLNPTGGLTVSGATNVNQYLTTGRNWYVSSPVSLATSAVFNAAAASSINKLYWYDETNGSSATLNWPLISDNSSSLAVTKGYVANVDASLLAATNGVTFTGGTLNTGPITTGLNSVPSLTRSSSQAYPGYNLVGNPYPSYLDWVAASAASTNMDASIWYRTKNGGVYEFDTYNAVSGVGTSNATVVTQYIPPMQAFWVRVSAGQTTGTLALTNAMRSHESGTNRLKAATVKASVQSLLRLQVSNGVNSDQALVLFNPNASNVYDAYDSPKRSNANTAIPEIYTIAGTEHVVINGLTSVVQNQELALGFTPGSSSSFSIKAMEMSNFDTDTRIFLRDSKTNAEQDLTDGSAYTFSSDAASTATRFALVFKTSLAPTAVNEVLDEVNSIVVLKNANNQIAVTIPTELVGKAMATVYNALGQRLESLPLSGTENVLNKAYSSGVYLVQVIANGKTTTRKVFIN